MSKQQSKKQQKEEQVKFEKIMEMYHHGNQEMAKYLALQAMENYIKSLMKKQFSTYVTKYFDDLLQEGYMAVLEGLETYDVKRAKPTTFFRFYIVHNMTEYITRFVNESTAHYQKNNQLIRQVERKYEKNHKEATDADIAIELGMNIETIKATRKIDGKTLNHIGVTPKRPLATCLIAEQRSLSVPAESRRSSLSPPSPVLDFPWRWFMAMASVSCASWEMEP